MAYARVNNAPPSFSSGSATSPAASLALRRDSPGSSLLGHGSPGALGDSPYGSTGSQHLRRRSLGQSGLGDSFSDESSSAAGFAGAVAAAPLDGRPYSKLAEADDELHNPRNADAHSNALSLRGLLNVLTLAVIGCGLLALFMGYPIIAHYTAKVESTKGAFNIGGTNGSGQVATFPGQRRLVDPDTPVAAQKWTGSLGNYHIVFSDEFETEGRTFWPGDDPFWEAVDIWYGATGDYEWYSPEAVNTTDGALTITLLEMETHALNFRSGMVQSWNKLCYQGGYIEFAIMMPGTQLTSGYWPAAWTMGNLGRPGYLGSTAGMWPYSYPAACDTGILPNQTWTNKTGPDRAIHSTGEYQDPKGQLSTLPGMRTPACTCPGEDHPGPNNNVGRSSPEIDVLEAQVQTHSGDTHVWASQSLQTAPFDDDYFWVNTSDVADLSAARGDKTRINDYVGGPLQESVSALSQCPDTGFTGTASQYIRYGMEYSPDWDANGSGEVTWYVDGERTWTIKGAAIGPVPKLDISQRTVPTEPMSIIMNLGVSPQFQTVDLNSGTSKQLVFPAQMKVDYVRLYQLDGQQDRLSCDPTDHPTAKYIEDHKVLYTNPNLTTYESGGFQTVKNRLKDGC